MGDYGSGDISTGESAPTPTVRDHAWLVEQGKKVMRALNRKKPDYDTAYDWLSTWAPWEVMFIKQQVHKNQARNNIINFLSMLVLVFY